jgi:hypothetical protein
MIPDESTAPRYAIICGSGSSGSAWEPVATGSTRRCYLCLTQLTSRQWLTPWLRRSLNFRARGC